MSTCRKAFTLIELLVVIAIIVVLIAVLLPSLSGAKKQAQTVACGSNLKQIGLAMNMYSQEYNQYFTPFMSKGSTSAYNNWAWAMYLSPDPVDGVVPRWFNLLRAYTTTYKVFNCPVQNTMSAGSLPNPLAGNSTQVAYVDRQSDLPSASWIVAGRSGVGMTCNYAYNPKSISEFADASAFSVWGGGVAQYKARTYNEVLQFANATSVPFNNLVVVIDGYHLINDSGVSNPTDINDLYRACGKWRYIHNNQQANVLFPDSHVEPTTADQITSALTSGSPSLRMVYKR